mmetsp:Transcript_28923/g.83566  ORF Transcript_28923/g.83566 Transcript_28923/m.83566 type:complete len:80 (+) Transcript_28923:36-275(+)
MMSVLCDGVSHKSSQPHGVIHSSHNCVSHAAHVVMDGVRPTLISCHSQSLPDKLWLSMSTPHHHHHRTHNASYHSHTVI